MKALLQTVSNGWVPVPPEKRFLINKRRRIVMIVRKRELLVIQLLIGMVLLSGCASSRPKNAETAAHEVVVHQLVKATQSWDGATLPAYPAGQPEITILDITVPPGVRLADHYHPVINAGVMLSGQLTVVTEDGKTLHLKAGDPIIEVVGTPHYGKNEGSVPARLIVFYAGIQKEPITTVIDQ